MDEAEDQINDLEHKKTKNNQSEQQEEKRIPPQNEYSINSIWDNFKRSNICIIRVPEGGEKEREIGNLSEKLVIENFPNLVKEIDMQVQDTHIVPVMMDAEAHCKTHHY